MEIHAIPGAWRILKKNGLEFFVTTKAGNVMGSLWRNKTEPDEGKLYVRIEERRLDKLKSEACLLLYINKFFIKIFILFNGYFIVDLNLFIELLYYFPKIFICFMLTRSRICKIHYLADIFDSIKENFSPGNARFGLGMNIKIFKRG